MSELRSGKWPVIWALMAIIGAVGATAGLEAAPKPALVAPPGTWQLDLELHGNPQQINIRLPGDIESRRFWYLLYTVANNTPEEVEFYPQFDLYTNTFKLYHSGVRVPRAVFEAIRKRHKTRIPLLEPDNMLTGRILVGQDNARDSVAIFTDFDPNATSASIFIAGLSNETITIKPPAVKKSAAGVIDGSAKEQKEVLLRKTLMLQYQVPGDRFNLADRVMLYRGRDWVMR